MRTMKMNQNIGLSSVSAAACIPDGNLAIGGQIRGGFGQQGAGDQLLLSSLADGSIVLSADAAAGLVYMIEEEKMARDLYDAFAKQTGSVVFDKISDSEQKHYDTLVTIADKAGLDISGISTTAAVFTSQVIQSLYDSLLAQGSTSLAAAYGVGVIVEQTDIADLQDYVSGTDIGIVGTVYAHLEVASEHHLAAFTSSAALV